MLFLRLFNLFLVFVFLSSSSVAWSQQVPLDAMSGVVEKGILSSRAGGTMGWTNDLNPQALQPSEDPAVEREREIIVGSFDFSGNTVFTAHELSRMLQQYVLRPLRSEELKEMLDVVNAQYRKKGFFLARAVFPVQEFNKWILKIVIVEGRLGEVSVKGEQDQAAIKKYFSCTVNDIVNYNKLAASLQSLNKSEASVVRAVLSPGAQPGTVDVLLDVSPRKGAGNFELADLVVGAEKLDLQEKLGFEVCDHDYFSSSAFQDVAAAGGVPQGDSSRLVTAGGAESSGQTGDVSRRLDYPESELKMMEEQKIEVGSFSFDGNTIFTGHELSALLEPYLLKPLRFKDLQEILGVINSHYKKKGFFLARAILPAQDFSNWVLKVVVVEGRLGDVVVDGNKHYTTEFIKSHFSCSVKGVINYREMYRSLLLLNEYPNVFVKVVMRKGQQPGTADIVLKVNDKSPTRFFVDANNYGSRNVTKYFGGMGMDRSNLLLDGDKVQVQGVMGVPVNTLAYGKIDYSLALNRAGTRFGVSYDKTAFEVQKEFRAIDAKGASETLSFFLTHPVYRDLNQKADVQLGFDIKKSENHMLGQLSSEDNLRVLRMALNADRMDASRNGRNTLSLELSQGIPDVLGGSRANDDLASRVGAGGDFAKTNVELARFQKLPFRSIITTRARAQFSGDILPSVEQFSIGGANTVRGFSQSKHTGDYGVVLNSELLSPIPFSEEVRIPFTRKYVDEVIRIAGFVDYGMAYLNNPQVGEYTDYEIAGVGVGLRFDFGQDFNAKLDVGFPVAGKDAESGGGPETYFQVFKKF